MIYVIPLLPDSQPHFERMHRLSPLELQEVQQQVLDLLYKKLTEPSTSLPSLFVEKKTGMGRWQTTGPLTKSL